MDIIILSDRPFYLPTQISAAFAIAGAVILAACQSSIQSSPASSLPSWDNQPTARDKAEWVRHFGLKEASKTEIARAKTSEAPFINSVATAPSGAFRVTFHLGDRLPMENGHSSTTSYYTLTDSRTAAVLAQVPSSLFKSLEAGSIYKQAVWFSRSERYALIYEDWSDGSAVHSNAIFLSADAAAQRWSIRYLAIPEFRGYPGNAEHGPVPVGIIEDTVVFDPMVTDRVYKRVARDLPESEPPVPFNIG